MAGRTITTDQGYIHPNTGNLTLGYVTGTGAEQASDDASGHATYQYAKKDIFIPVPLSTLLVAEVTTSAVWDYPGADFATTYAAGAVGGIPLLTLKEDSKAYAVQACLQPPVGYRIFAGAGTDPYASAVSAPHGAMLLDVTFNYRPVTASISAFTAVFFTEALLTSAASGATTGAARATQAAYGGTVLYEQPVGTACVAGSLLVACPDTAAYFYTVKVKPTTPVFLNTDYSALYFQINATTGAGDCDIGQIIAHWAVALY